MKLFTLAVILTALGALACSGEESGPKGNACDYIVGRTFTTPDERNCGAGVAPCMWTVTFNTDGTYRYTYEDQIIERSYQCNDSLGIVDRNGNSLGSYSPETDQLTWSGTTYE